MVSSVYFVLLTTLCLTNVADCHSTKYNVSGIMTDKKKALGFLKHRRYKRGLSEECREGCYWEEVAEIYEPNSERSKEYMRNWKCNRLMAAGQCPAGCFALIPNYSHSNNLLMACKPHCDRKGNPLACDILYSNDRQISRVGTYIYGYGTCQSVDVCTGCNTDQGFYNGQMYCYMCGQIANCNFRGCTDNNQNLICKWCDGEIIERQYWRAYTGHLDGRKSCQKTCSWRSDSTRCFPGSCGSELASNCVCATNFAGHHCEEITDFPPILFNHGVFYDDPVRRLYKVENDPNYVQNDHPIIWTNIQQLKVMYTEMASKYLQPNPGDLSDHYVRDFRVGLKEMKTSLLFYRGGVYRRTETQLCNVSYMVSIPSHLECPQIFPLSKYVYYSGWTAIKWLPFQHDDKIIYRVSATNGGFVKVQDRDRLPTEVIYSYNYIGKTTTRDFEYHWDLVRPYHCSVVSGISCTPFLWINSDVTDVGTISFTWGGWTDDLSGVSHYQYELFDLVPMPEGLQDGTSMKDSGLLPWPNTSFSSSLLVTEPGVYSIHISAFDKAGNDKTGRGLFFFDDQSVVTLHGEKVKCFTASHDTSYVWVIQDTNMVEIGWKDRFMNVRHKQNRWLNPVLNMHAGVHPVYEDLYGNRTNLEVKNIHGIVEFRVSFTVYGLTLKDSRPLTSLPSAQLMNQFEWLTVNWADGDQLNVTVQAYDIIGEYNEETITVYRDVSPPIIENLWLTRGDRLNVSVHSLQDFTQMTIEWEAYDDHSGLDSVYWKLYDSYGHYIEHGHEDIIAQGDTDDLTECQTKYGFYARGANCYCTSHMGCYHRHFQVKPEIKAHGGLKLNLDQGSHDSDYFIEISVTNKANQTTVSTKKITIDISPPHAGVVHDGLQGNPEIDYQQGMDLKAYWDQFFDRESGVFFYQYIVGTSCADKSDFDLNKTHPNIVETYNTFASHTASTDGTYYFTVMAYNRALDGSDPVCSDGVTIDSSVPGVKEVTVKDSLITGGLVTDSTQTNYYILGKDRIRRKISNPTPDCVSKASIQNDIDLYPLDKYENNSATEVNGTIFCSNSSGAPSNIGLNLFKSSLLEMSWEPVDIPAKVFDYEVGIATTAGSAAPDILAFESTKQHAHHRIMHTNIPDALRFYIIIKTISKSNVEGLTTLGPCFMDTTPPDFTGSVTVSLSGDYLVASWAANAFSDSEELFELDYQFSIGQHAYGTEIQNDTPIQGGGSCVLSVPPTCTAVSTSELDWNLHGHHTYYVSIKVTNTAGLATIQTSSPYIHDVQLPAEGVVLDIDTLYFPTEIPLKDIEDRDFQTSTTSMAARWSGFAHPHLDVTYKISIGSTKGGSDVIAIKDVGSALSHKETGLSLTPYQKYYFTVIAVSSAGQTSVSSDGVTIVTENDVLSGVNIFDGLPCNITVDYVLSHHDEDNRMPCLDDIDVQMSLNSLKAYWTVPADIQSYTTDAFIAVEERTVVGYMWFTFHDFIPIRTVYDISINDLTLSPGVMYRIVLKLCAKTICFQSVYSDGIMVIANPPVSGGLTVEHRNTTQTGGAEKLLVTMEMFYDPDIEIITEKYDAIENYEYSITDDSVQGKTYMTWTKLVSYTTSGNQMSFEVLLNGTMDFSKCKRFTVRGYNQVKLYSVVTSDIKDCKAVNPSLVKPNLIIDAVGNPGAVDGIGRTVYLRKNDLWEIPDQDYTPYKNVLSAVWPTLRHRDYKYAIINARTVDVTSYYEQVNQLNMVDPCTHPDAIRCGTTDREFINEEFTNGELVHGTRYTVCLYAPLKFIQRETWVQEIAPVSSCSDGIVVDLTPPKIGRIWIGTSLQVQYQNTKTDLYVTWDGFEDVEEFDTGPHSTGIQNYIIGIGSSHEGNDIVAFHDIGISQHKAFHQLHLQNGYKYYATIKAVDFANRTTVAVSEPVMVDMTPPETSNNPITISNRHITSRTEINPCWKGVFSDLESGIAYYMWSVGSEPGYTDMMSYMKVSVGEECAITDENNPLDLQDGHYYYINIRAFNYAGLSTLATSWAFQVDTTPPVAGHVYDGDITLLSTDIMDIDYQTETKVLSAHWIGFHDAHSTIKDYYISIGTCPQCQDVLPEQAIGIVYEFTLKNVHLGPGLRYYTTIIACNTADMCTTVTSDGVIIDNSAPTAGAVQDGVGYYDTEYQSMRTYIAAKWYGFSDPQSGLEKFVWRAGTSKWGNDIVSETMLHLTETTTLYDVSLGLPLNQRIYVTVRAYNKAGLWSESSSNGFVIDDTPPTISSGPTFSNDFGIMGLTQIYRTSMKVEWAVEDQDSYIKRQYLSIKSHVGGEFPLSSLHVNGIARSYVFTGLDLHDGVTYYVTLISCNSAEMCTNSTSPGMFVDSTPPSRGMFAIETDHASDPDRSRHAHGWMTWSAHAVYLAWLGFSDVHSGIDHYKVAVGTSYMENDLNKYDQEFDHTVSNSQHGDEGFVQLFTVETASLTDYETIFISVWAVNGVGLRSHMIHSAFTKVPGGALDLIRRCDAMSCEGHCICAPQDQKCPFNPSLGNCSDVSLNSADTLLLVEDSNGYSSKDQAVTASDNVLRGMWIVSQVQGMRPKWYEWSVGYATFDTPLGIYDVVDDKVWQDAGQNLNYVFTTKQGEKLHNSVTYAFFVRVWYSTNHYAVFKSNGILVMGQAPVLATKRGKAVTENVQGTPGKDIDFMRMGRPITFDWDGKFLDAENTISRYDIYLSTFQGGYDIMTVTSGVPGTKTAFNMTGMKLTPGVIHYSNVIAYNYAGAHTTATSDGFVIDHYSPTAGIVYDGIALQDIEYKNSSDTVAAHWHGFTDTESGIKNYYWCVGATLALNQRRPEDTECDILSWTNVGLHTSVSRNISNIPQGTRIYNKVYAIDNVGFKSSVIVSDGAVIDTTIPIPDQFLHIDENLVENPSFENSEGSEIMWNNITSVDICMLSPSYHPLSWIPTQSSCMSIISSETNLAKEGRSFLYIRGCIHQQLLNIVKGRLYRISFYSSHLPGTDSVSSNKEGFVQLGEGTKHVFLMYTKPYRKDGHFSQIGREELSWHTHKYYFIATENAANISIGSVDVTTGIFIDDLSVQEVNLTSGHLGGHVHGHVVYLHEWGSIHGSWSFSDPESTIVDYTWAIGYSEGGTQIQPFKSTGLVNFGFNNNVTLVHDTYIYLTIIATNAAGLKGITYSDPILVDLTPPDIKFVYDGRGEDESAWTFNEVAANWDMEDLESGIKICKWAIGYSPGTTDLLEFTVITGKSAFMDFPYDLLEGHTIYTTLSCENNAGLSSSMSSNGVKVSNNPPSANGTNIKLISLSKTEYNAVEEYQGLSDTMRMKWTGFSDSIGVETFKVSYQGSQSETMFFPSDQEVLYSHFTKMSMTDDIQTVSVQAVNKLYLKSDTISENITVNTAAPSVDSTKSLGLSWVNNEIVVTWQDIFTSVHHMYYEVTAGTNPSGVNIIQWQFTNQTYITFGIPPSVNTDREINIYINVRAMSVGGYYSQKWGYFKIP